MLVQASKLPPVFVSNGNGVRSWSDCNGWGGLEGRLSVGCGMLGWVKGWYYSTKVESVGIRLLQVSREVSALAGSFYCTKVVCKRIGILGT